jgi:hypothetical protein
MWHKMETPFMSNKYVLPLQQVTMCTIIQRPGKIILLCIHTHYFRKQITVVSKNNFFLNLILLLLLLLLLFLFLLAELSLCSYEY